MLFSIFSSATIVYQAYLEGDSEGNLSPRTQAIQFALKQIDLAFSILFFNDWSIQFFLADRKGEFLTSFYSMIDLVTVIPSFFLYNYTTKEFEELQGLLDWIIYLMTALTATRILRSLRLRMYMMNIKDEVRRHLGDMILIFVTMILFDAALMQFLERHEDHDNLLFNDWLYYVFVTLATVGYGDISPKSLLGRLAAMGYVFLAVTLVPKLTSQLIEKMNKASIYSRDSFKLKKASTHVVICGDLNSVQLHEFFNELFHEDHEILNLVAVVMQPEYPSPAILSILKDPDFQVQYLDGSVFNDSDLKRARVDAALGVFVFANKNIPNPDQEDAKTILQHFCIPRFLSTSPTENHPVCIQLLRSENIHHLRENKNGKTRDLVVCLDEIKMGLIAKTILFPGANTLLFNLLSSFAEDKDEDLEDEIDANEGNDIDNLKSVADNDWMAEYTKGCDWEIYTTHLADLFTGTIFVDLAWVYSNKEAVC